MSSAPPNITIFLAVPLSHFEYSLTHPSLPPPFLSLGYRVFAVDLLGFGGSDKVKEGVEYELELWRDLLVDFMEVRMSVNEKRGLSADRWASV
jgi:pimeloyl-ACP methyl ester carboxylesterase